MASRVGKLGPGWNARRRGWSRLTVIAVSSLTLGVTTVATVASLPTAATAVTAMANPYSGSGFDLGYPQCGATTLPSGFAVVGLGGGRPFTTSSCVATQWSLAANSTNGTSATPSTPSLYFNTGYVGAYAKNVTPTCSAAAANAPILPGTATHVAKVETTAWEIGCSEAGYAQSHEPGSPAVWWADVESGNSWSKNQVYNQFAVDGLAYEMNASGLPSGFYSTPASWSKIVGAGFSSTPGVNANWLPATTCSQLGFDGAAMWLMQSGLSTLNSVNFDQDASC